MSVEFARMQQVFQSAVEQHRPENWDAYLDQACAGDDELRDQVQLLLKAHREAGSVPGAAARAPGQTNAYQHPTETAGTVIGPYKLLQQIGEGGMGVVWMAEQTQPVQRKVALKVIKPGMDSRQVIARFEAERQALAMMDHVNIARVFDGGATENGRPYFVMELVHGVPITKYCDDNHLTPRERLELFVPVCQAIQHAHQKGIIHRDIKPSNVMITLYDGKPVPKVIDFGVAKATEQKLTERTLFTQYGTMVGTLEYMSPEQAEMSALGVDTRSDIYSLGVLLYELLTGNTPLSHKTMKEAAYAEILRMIKEEEPPKPSTRLSDSGEALASISANRHTEPARLSKLMRGELDWIVMKTLEKDRNRRYETAKDFAADVQRYLNDEPVLACPPSVVYRFRKFARRNRAVLITIAVIALAVLVAVGGLAGSVGWVARDRAARQVAIEQEVNLALKEAERFQQQAKYSDALSAIKRAEGLLAGGAGHHEIQQHVRELRTDLDMVVRLDEIRLGAEAASDVGPISFERIDQAYAKAFRDYGLDLDTLAAQPAADQIRARTIGAELAVALDDWALFRRRLPRARPEGWKHLLAVARAADPDPWRNRLRDAVEQRNKKDLLKLAESDEVAALPASTFHLLGRSLYSSEALGPAVALLRPAQERYPGDFWINHLLGLYLSDLCPPQWEDVIRFCTAAVALRSQSAGAHNNLGWALHNRGRLEEAIAEYREAIRLDPNQAAFHNNLGWALHKRDHVDEAIPEYREAIRLDPNRAAFHNNLGAALQDNRTWEGAIAEYAKAIKLAPENALRHNNLAWLLATCPEPKFRDAKRAVELAKKAVKLAPKDGNNWNTLGVAHYRADDWKAAIAALEKSLKLRKGGDSYDWFFLAMAHWQLGEKEEARQSYDRATVWMEKNQPNNEELRRFRSEAAQLLKLEAEPKPVPKSK